MQTRRRAGRVLGGVALVLTATGLAHVSSASSGAEPVILRPTLVVPVAGGLALVDMAGGPPAFVPGSEPGDADPALSPDGSRIALVRRAGRDDEIVIVELWSGEVHQLTANLVSDASPSWSPDGRRVAWASGAPGSFELYVMGRDGHGKRRIVRSPGNDVDPTWAPDGQRIAFASNRSGSYDLMTVLASGGEATSLGIRPGDERRPAWSPRGDRIAYVQTRGSATRVYLTDPTGTLDRSLTSGTVSATRPAWAPDGLRIAFARVSGGHVEPWLVHLNGNGATRVSPPFPARPDGLAFGVAVAGMKGLAGERLPDLDQRAPAGLVIGRTGSRVTLGFASAVDNVGLGPLWIKGSRSSATSSTMRADQLVETSGAVNVYRAVGRLRYTRHPPHYHWHFQSFERYELYRASDFAFLVRDRKSGFCLADHYGQAATRVAHISPPRFLGDCGKGDPTLRHVDQGNSAGYTDRYPAFFHGQDIDITGIEPGLYVIVHRANPERLVHELRYDNNAASVLIRLGRPSVAGGVPSLAVLRTCQTTELCLPVH